MTEERARTKQSRRTGGTEELTARGERGTREEGVPRRETGLENQETATTRGRGRKGRGLSRSRPRKKGGGTHRTTKKHKEKLVWKTRRDRDQSKPMEGGNRQQEGGEGRGETFPGADQDDTRREGNAGGKCQGRHTHEETGLGNQETETRPNRWEGGRPTTRGGRRKGRGLSGSRPR
jgi:hypothetical protein